MNNYSYNNSASLPTLVILILIILQFNRKGRSRFTLPIVTDTKEARFTPRKRSRSGNLVDNSILFIIALYFLSCCNTSKMI